MFQTAPGSRAALPFHAQAVRTGLSPRYLGGLVEISGRSWQVILVEQGSVTLSHPDGTEAVPAPAVLWIADGDTVRIQAKAGSTVGHLILGEATLTNAIGLKPEAVDLRLFAGRNFRLPLTDNKELRRDVERAFDLVLREAYERSPGYETVAEAQIRVLLVLLWRNAVRPDDLREASAPSAMILQNFRHLVETHFRERWSVAQYARELGVSTDRLHATCTRVLGTPPLRLIHARTAQEAEVLLERSTQTLDQIAAYLGFRSTPQFSAFFKSETGHPPGAWRKAMRGAVQNSSNVQKRSYADWP